MFGIRTRITRARHRLEGRRDAGHLERIDLRLRPSRAELAAIAEELRPPYERYVRDVSESGMAASLETSCYLAHLCRAFAPASACDLGSGFSSYVLRRYAQSAVSVDDSPEWLERTGQFLAAEGMPLGGLLSWDQIRTSTSRFRIVLHDLAGGEVREATMPDAVRLLDASGVIVLDDAQHDGHRARMRQVAREKGLRLFSLHALTVDSIGRWSIVGVPHA